MKFNLKKVCAILLMMLFCDFMLIGCNNASSSTISSTNELTKNSVLISPYDDLIKQAADESGYDWRLLSAIAYAESRFQPNVKSRVGAVGLMQIMPKTAKHFGVELDEAKDPQTNVDLAVKVLKNIETTLRFGQTEEEQKLRIMLAGYNSGIGNLIEARKIAASNGVNHNSWEQLKNYGAVNNSETRSFVEKVITKYNQYKQLY